MNIHNTIKSHIETLAAGEIITPKALLPFGSREAVDQVLSRLSKEGLISRVSRGVYCKPILGRWGSYLPEAFAIAKSLSELHGEVIAPHGAVAVNYFQLSTQNPLQLVLLTTGRSKTAKNSCNCETSRCDFHVKLPIAAVGDDISLTAARPRFTRRRHAPVQREFENPCGGGCRCVATG